MFYESSYSLINLTVSAKSDRSKFKTILKFLQQYAQKFLISFCKDVSDPCLEILQFYQQRRRGHSPSQILLSCKANN